MPTFSIGRDANYSVTVSDIDFAYLTQWKWNFLISNAGLIYARRSVTVGSRKDGTRRVLTITLHSLVIDRMGLPRPSPLHTRDHINGDTLDDRRENLRWLTPKQQQANRRIVFQRSQAQKPVSPKLALNLGGLITTPF